MSTSSELRTPAMTARIQEAFGVRPFELYGDDRRPVGRRVRPAHRHPPVRGHDDRRERRRGRPARARRRARGAAARHQPLQPHPAADPPRGRRRRHARPRPVPVRAHADAHPLDRRAAATTCSSCPARRRDRLRSPAAVRGRRPRPRSGRVPGRTGRPAAAAARGRPRRGAGARDAATHGGRAAPARRRVAEPAVEVDGFPRSRASRAASSRSSSPTAAPAGRRATHKAHR